MQDAVAVPTISENVIKFKQTKNPYYLAKAIYMVIRRGRTHELFYGLYCQWVHKPSVVVANDDVEEILAHFHENILFYKREFLNKQQLQEIYGDRFAINKLPEVFGGTRSMSIIETENKLIMGEYDEDNDSSRIATLTADSCHINDNYMGMSGIRHIHSLQTYDKEHIIVATGDRLKVLDLWTNKDNKLSFSKRLIRFLAGYTAMIKVDGELYSGTDFSSRPNYIEMENRNKFFFPEPAYMMYVMSFHAYKDRYLLSLNSSLDEYGSGKTLSIFDTKNKQFVYCDKVDLPH
jgi:hypothetical protein